MSKSPLRNLSALLLALVFCLGSAGTSWAADNPGAGIYTPTFITETDQPSPWIDCMWASATMLLDKWSAGSLKVDRHVLRAASGDTDGGSSMYDVARGTQKLYGLNLAYSPDGGDPMTWADLLDRLSHGAGAVLGGNYSKLPEHYTRWDPRFAAKENPAHAVYVERYDVANDRVWLMDPLGRGDYDGEWISVANLRAFAYIARGGLVFATASPTVALAPSADGYTFGAFTWRNLPINSREAGFSIPIAKAGPLALPVMAAHLTWTEEQSYPPIPASPTGLQIPVSDDVASTASAGASPGSLEIDSSEFSVVVLESDLPLTLTADGVTLEGELIPPAGSGHYTLTVQLMTDDHPVAEPQTQSLDLFGEWGATYQITAPESASADGSSLPVSVTLTNAGSNSWIQVDNFSPLLHSLKGMVYLEASWDWATKPAATVRMNLSSGESADLDLTMPAPGPGDHTLWLDLRMSDGRTFSSLGMPRGELDITVPGTPSHLLLSQAHQPLE